MTKEQYIKIERLYRCLTQLWGLNRQEEYIFFERRKLEKNNDVWNFLVQFTNIPLKAFFNPNYNMVSLYPNYYEKETIKINDTFIFIHNEFSRLLYFYCTYKLRKELQEFFEILNNENYICFKYPFKKDEKSFIYFVRDHEEIYLFFSSKVHNFSLVGYLLSLGKIIKIQDNYIYIYYNEIELLLSNLINYNFKEFNI